MQYTRLGRSGLQVSRLALGMMTYGTSRWREWILDEQASRPLVRRAVELGFTFFDTADMYSAGESEVLTGKFVREFCRRDEAVIATKVFYPVDLEFKGGYAAGGRIERPNTSGLGRKRIFQAIDASLQRLGTDYVDLYQIHRLDPHTPLEETMQALHDVVRSGKARYIGASSMWAWQFAKAQAIAREHHLTPFISMQNHYNLVYREEEREMIPLCVDQGIGIVPWSPLARGFLAGNRSKEDKAHGATRRAETDQYAQQLYYRDSDFRVVQTLTELAGELDISAATLAYAWLLHKPGVTAPIIGASKPGQLEAAVAALEVSLKPEQMAALEAAYEPHPVLGHQ